MAIRMEPASAFLIRGVPSNDGTGVRTGESRLGWLWCRAMEPCWRASLLLLAIDVSIGGGKVTRGVAPKSAGREPGMMTICVRLGVRSWLYSDHLISVQMSRRCKRPVFSLLLRLLKLLSYGEVKPVRPYKHQLSSQECNARQVIERGPGR